MPTSRSPKPSVSGKSRPLPPPRSPLRLLIPLIVVAVLVVAVIALPASLIGRFLPRSVSAADYSGSVWHGSVGNLSAGGRNLGAIEWHLHPAALLAGTLAADLHWVKVGFLADGAATLDAQGMTLRGVQGGGPLEDLADLGVGAGWHGNATFAFKELTLVFAKSTGGPLSLQSVVGELNVANLASPQVADGVDLGSYALHLAGPATGSTDTQAELTDTGGPLEVQATIQLSAGGHTGMLSGTVKERPGIPPALQGQIDNLAQMHARDAAGRIPVDLEFTL